MRVRCVAESVTAEQGAKLGPLYQGGRQSFGVKLGSEYLVFGISVADGAVLLEIAQEYDQLYPVPMLLFEIVDPKVPSLWQARQSEDGTLFLWPPSFFDREYYHQDLVEQVPSVVEDFRRVRRRLELETEL